METLLERLTKTANEYVEEQKAPLIVKNDALEKAVAAGKTTIAERDATILRQAAEIKRLNAIIAELQKPTEPPVEPPKEPPVIVPGDEHASFYRWSRLKRLRRSGESFDLMLKRARGNWQAPIFWGEKPSNNAQGDADVLSGAVAAETLDDEPLREKTRAQLRLAATKDSNWLLGLSRQLPGYVEAALLIRFGERAFVDWIHSRITLSHGPGQRWGSLDTILVTGFSFNSNWGFMSLRAIVVSCIYLKQYGTPSQQADAAKWLRLAVLQYKRLIGEPDDYSELPALITAKNGWGGSTGPEYGINPEGSTFVDGDGVTRDGNGIVQGDWLRTEWEGKEDREAKHYPPNPVTYHWEGLTALTVLAAILDNLGLVPFKSGNNAIVRAFKALCGQSNNTPAFNNPPQKDDLIGPHIVYHYTGVDFGRKLDYEPDKAGYCWLTWYFGELEDAA